MRAIVVGVGNPVRADDGVGLAVARAVRERLEAGRGVEVEELWAGGLRLAEAMAGFDRAVVVDAMTTGACPPGTVSILEMSDLCCARTVDCVHDATFSAAFEMLRRAGEEMPGDVSVIGIEVKETDTLDESLTEPVRLAVPVAVEAVFSALGGAK